MKHRKFVSAFRRRKAIDFNTVVFHQDVVPLRCSDGTLQYLRQYWPGNMLISRRTYNLWPSYSADRNPLTTFFRDILKTEYTRIIQGQLRHWKKIFRKKFPERCCTEFWTISTFALIVSFINVVLGLSTLSLEKNVVKTL